MEISFGALGTVPDWLGLVITILGLAGGTASGSYIAARRRMMLEDRRRLFDHHLPDLKIDSNTVDLAGRRQFWREVYDISITPGVLQIAAFGNAIAAIDKLVEVLTWVERALWKDLRDRIEHPHLQREELSSAPELEDPLVRLDKMDLESRVVYVNLEVMQVGEDSPVVKRLQRKAQEDLRSLWDSPRYRSAHADLYEYLRRAIAPRMLDRFRNRLLLLRLFRRAALRFVKQNPLLTAAAVTCLALLLYLLLR